MRRSALRVRQNPRPSCCKISVLLAVAYTARSYFPVDTVCREYRSDQDHFRTSWVRLGRECPDGTSVEDHRQQISFRHKEHLADKSELDHREAFRLGTEPPVDKPESVHHQILLFPSDKEHLVDTVDLARHRTSWIRLGTVYPDGISVEDHRRKVFYRRKEHRVDKAELAHHQTLPH
jgi:hypothetical protein